MSERQYDMYYEFSISIRPGCNAVVAQFFIYLAAEHVGQNPPMYSDGKRSR